MSQLSAVFKKVKFLAELPAAESLELSKVSELLTYSDGMTVFTQGDKLPGVFVVSKGALKVYRSAGRGKNQVLDVLTPGQCVGEVQIFSDGMAITNAEAHGNTECWLIPSTILRQMTNKNPIVAEALLRHLAGKIKHLVPLVETISLHSVPERVARLILDYYKKTSSKSFVEFNETQEELAQYIGSSREAFNRALRLLADLGLIHTSFPVVHIVDAQKLKRYSKG